jgi:hypothetical protein
VIKAKKRIKQSKWLVLTGASLCLMVLLVLSYWPAGTLGSGSLTFNEDFSTADYRDAGLTTANWDTVAGNIKAVETYWSDMPGFGVVHDRASGQPLKQAIIRVFDTTYNKLLGTEIANSQGQYCFLVGRGKYYLTSSKEGYQKYQSSHLDLTNTSEPAIKENIPMKK